MLIIRIMMVLFFFQQVVFAEEKICTDKIDLGVYTIGYLYFTKGSNYSGIDKDVIDEIEKRTNCVFTKELMARARIWNEMKAGRLSMTVSGISTPEREEYAYFIPYFKAKNQLLIINKYSNLKKIEDIIENNNINFYKVRAFKHGDFFDKMFDSLKDSKRIHDVVNVEDTYLAIQNGKGQALVSLNVVIPYWLEKLSLQKTLSIIPFELNTDKIPHGLVLSRKKFTDAQINKFSKVINDMKKDGTLFNIFKKYLGEEIAADIMI